MLGVFSDPRSLALITPKALDFQILSELPPEIYPEMMIEYRVRPLLGRRFVDEQRVGPSAIWHHEHTFTPIEGGRTEIRDVVHYTLPLGWLGNIVHPFLVAPELRRILPFREKAVTERFGV